MEGEHTFGNVRQFREKLIEFLLTLIQLSSPDKIDSEQSHDAVDNQETVFIAHKVLGYFIQQLKLVL
jgi:hypothetical protein